MEKVVGTVRRASWVVIPAGFVALLVAWPQAIGLAGAPFVANLVAMRGLTLLILFGFAMACIVLGLLLPRLQMYMKIVGIVMLCGAAAIGLILQSRGWTSDPVTARASNDEVRVLAFNTLGAASADHLAELVSDVNADIVVLSETTRETTDQLATQLDGDYATFHEQPGVWHTSATGLLIRDRIGSYGKPNPHSSSQHGMFTVPAAAGRPTVGSVTAVHTVWPAPRRMKRWHDEVAWAIDQCRSTRGAIVVGDFNATLDHPALRDLGPCADAAQAVGAGAIGTWPDRLPAWLGTPIDHVIVDTRVWSVRSFSVLDNTLGSDHRPIVAILDPRDSATRR